MLQNCATQKNGVLLLNNTAWRQQDTYTCNIIQLILSTRMKKEGNRLIHMYLSEKKLHNTDETIGHI